MTFASLLSSAGPDLLSWPAASQTCPSSTCRLLHHHSLPPTTPRSSRFELLPFSFRSTRHISWSIWVTGYYFPLLPRCRDRPRAATFKPGAHISSFKVTLTVFSGLFWDCSSVINTVASPFQRSEQAPVSSSLHLPHWFTSNKADLDCSGITSVPDLKYPAWLQGCDLSEPPAQSDLWDDHGSFLDYICTNLPRCHSISSSFNRLWLLMLKINLLIGYSLLFYIKQPISV